MDAISIFVAGALGLAVGPFLRRAIDQVPGRDPLFADPDRPLRPRALAPVASWFDAEPYGATTYVLSPDERRALAPDTVAETVIRPRRALLIDLTVAAVMMVMAHRFGWSWELPAFLVLAASVVVVSVIDIDHYRIPNLVVYPTLLASSVLLVVAAAILDVPGGLIGAGAGALAYYSFLFVFFFIYPKGMGFGDVKLALVLGLHAGWAGSVVYFEGKYHYAGWVHGMRLVLMAALAGSLLGSVIGVGSLIGRRQRGAAFPFGPALCVGALLAIVFSEQILN